MKIADSKNLTATVASLVAVFALGAAGCSDRTEQAANNAAQGAAQDAQNHAAAAGQAVENADRATAAAVENAGQEVKEETREAGAAIQEGVNEAGEAIGGVGAQVQEGAQDLGAVVTLTPKVKNALVGSDQVNASNLNVETMADQQMVKLEGSVATQKQKTLATQIAQKTLREAKSNFKVQNNLTVSGGAATNR